MRGSLTAIACALAMATPAAIGQPAKRKKRKEPRDYRIRLDAKARIVVGTTGALSLTLSAKPGYSISRAGPVVIGLAVKPKRGLVPARTRYRRKHAADKRADDPRFDLRLAGKTVGRYVLEVEARFWACGRRSCRPVHDSRKVAVEVVEPPPPPPPADAGVPTTPAPSR